MRLRKLTALLSWSELTVLRLRPSVMPLPDPDEYGCGSGRKCAVAPSMDATKSPCYGTGAQRTAIVYAVGACHSVVRCPRLYDDSGGICFVSAEDRSQRCDHVSVNLGTLAARYFVDNRPRAPAEWPRTSLCKQNAA